jgi:hypothetical protein
MELAFAYLIFFFSSSLLRWFSRCQRRFDVAFFNHSLEAESSAVKRKPQKPANLLLAIPDSNSWSICPESGIHLLWLESYVIVFRRNLFELVQSSGSV